ncbi:hypothetical protein BDK51DRAFT_48857 [Blyttiomyces helicus]|uniref:histone deacetylase n=1 Tax=Blyttiomyces helicus TaxID=388810 RepID=A0A4P9WIP0_9FUNG|nr:hypothetical protein BDK51DRAFT_48857 [Blyttiomyces helicus]|eukprot:RKO91000.1 hypothetical protein BDK51DRAFT_48857 [Blyttiomyces helicus]
MASKRAREEKLDDEEERGVTPSVVVVTHMDCLLHRGNEGSRDSSGETPARITTLLSKIATTHPPPILPPRKRHLQIFSTPTHANLTDLLRVHSGAYITRLLDEIPHPSQRRLRHFSPGHSGVKTSFVSGGSLDAILAAAGAVVCAVDAVVGEKRGAETAFCVVRPPGHHCGWEGVESLGSPLDLAQGFCFVNNVMVGRWFLLFDAVGAAYASAAHGMRSVIFDYDVHHGNGTEGIVRHLLAVHDPTDGPFPFLFVSAHQYEIGDDDGTFYPGTGDIIPPSDPAYAHVINIPLPPGSGSNAFRTETERLAMARIASFRPDVIFISAGFDSHDEDEVGDLHLVDEDYDWIARRLRRVQRRVVSVLEGGYLGGKGEEPGLVTGAMAHLRGLMEPVEVGDGST